MSPKNVCAYGSMDYSPSVAGYWPGSLFTGKKKNEANIQTS